MIRFAEGSHKEDPDKRMNPDANITGVVGRVFGRDSAGVCTVQLDNYPSIIRVKTFQPGLAHHLKLAGCSILNPTGVIVDVGTYDATKMMFWGSICMLGTYQEISATSPETQSTHQPVSTNQVKTQSRLMQPMII
jgi:hypothetical protein